MSQSEFVVLPQGRHLLSKATYAVVPDVDIVSTVFFSNRLMKKGSPPFEVGLVDAGRSLKPKLVRDGKIFIERNVSFRRGDPDGDGRVSILDAVQVLLFLFVSGPAPACFEAADFDDDGRIDGSDPILILRWLFLNGDPPARPGASGSGCGPDPVGSPAELGCGNYPACR